MNTKTTIDTFDALCDCDFAPAEAKVENAPDGHTSWLAWESAVCAEYGGIVADWPEREREMLRAHEGYLPHE